MPKSVCLFACVLSVNELVCLILLLTFLQGFWAAFDYASHLSQNPTSIMLQYILREYDVNQARLREAARKGNLREVRALLTMCRIAIEAVDCDVSHACEWWCFSGHFGCLAITGCVVVHSAIQWSLQCNSLLGHQHMFLVCCI